LVLVGYWPLNESSGSTAYDHSGNENHGTINDGGDSTVPGASGILGQNAYNFDGSNDYVEIPDFAQLDADQFSRCLWFSPENNINGGEGRQDILSRSYGTYLLLNKDNNGTIGAWSYDDSGNSYAVKSNTNSWNSNDWYFITATYNGAELRIYVNGRLEGKNIASFTKSDRDKILRISRSGWHDGDYYSGKVSEVRIYDHALTPREVQYLYNVSKRGRQVSSEKQS
jgi:hypothetical protein